MESKQVDLLDILLILALIIMISMHLFAQNNPILYNVSVVGVVENPGVYPVVPTERVSGLLKIANIVEIASQRNIILRRDDKEVALDLQRFHLLGDKKQNPYLQDGDVIFLPARMDEITIIGKLPKI